MGARPIRIEVKMRLILLAALVGHVSAASLEISKGFEHFYNLEYEPAITEFTREIRQKPNDPYSYTHLAEALLYREMFNAGALESELVSGNNFFLSKAKPRRGWLRTRKIRKPYMPWASRMDLEPITIS